MVQLLVENSGDTTLNSVIEFGGHQNSNSGIAPKGAQERSPKFFIRYFLSEVSFKRLGVREGRGAASFL